MKIILILGFLLSSISFAQTLELKLSTDVYQNQEEEFLPHDNFLAMTIRYAPIEKLHAQIEDALNTNLETDGEAKITVITKAEFEVLKSKFSMKEIDALASRYDIQMARLMILGVGSGQRMIEGKLESTYFVIVDSYELRTIRQMIFYEFTRRGGDRSAFDPTWYFPHITLGYPQRDLDESDGLLKNLKHTFDSRFILKVTP